jgi:hypothetical protein
MIQSYSSQSRRQIFCEVRQSDTDAYHHRSVLSTVYHAVARRKEIKMPSRSRDMSVKITRPISLAENAIYFRTLIDSADKAGEIINDNNIVNFIAGRYQRMSLDDIRDSLIVAGYAQRFPNACTDRRNAKRQQYIEAANNIQGLMERRHQWLTTRLKRIEELKLAKYRYTANTLPLHRKYPTAKNN